MSKENLSKKIPGRGKKYSDVSEKVDRSKVYGLKEAFELLPKLSYAKFDESVDVAFRLGIDPKQTDQSVRGAVVLPHGTGKSVRIAVFAKGEKAKEAEQAGADIVGAEDLIEKIQGGFLEFDTVIATPDLMVAVSKVGKILGPKGLMPNPKLGQVTFDVGTAVGDQKKGKVEYRAEKAGIVHCSIGKKSFGSEKLKENFMTLSGAVIKSKPSTSKGTYIRKVTLSTTMSPSLHLDSSEVVTEAS